MTHDPENSSSKPVFGPADAPLQPRNVYADWHPGGSYPDSPPNWPVPRSPRRTFRRRWTIGAAGAFVVIAAAVILVLTTQSSPKVKQSTPISTPLPTGPSLAPLPLTALDTLLPKPEDVAAEMSVPLLTASSKPEESHAFYADSIVDNDCVGVIFAAAQLFYEGSGWISMRKQSLVDTPDRVAQKLAVTEAVVGYADAGAASKFFQRATDTFRKCANRNINAREVNEANGRTSYASVGAVSNKDGILSSSLLWEGANGWGCRHALLIRNNIAVDVYPCGYKVDESALTALIKPIVSKIDSQR